MIIITGAAGFIGSAMVWKLNKLGIEDILIVDRLGNDLKWRNLINLKFKDYMDKEVFIQKVEKDSYFEVVEGLLHFGAISSTTENDADSLMTNNYEYTKVIALASIKKGWRFVYASSAATYGDGSYGFSDDHSKLILFRPLNMYAYSKHLFDLWALKHGLLDKIAGLKYFNVFGPNEYHKCDMRSVVHKAFEQIQATGRVRLFKSHRPDYADGGQLRDFIYVKDAVEMTWFIYKNLKLNGIFNIATGKARSFYDLALAVFSSMGKSPEIEYFDMPENIRDKYQYFTQGEMNKLKKAGYDKNTWELEDAVADYVKNYLLNDDPYLGNKKESH